MLLGVTHTQKSDLCFFVIACIILKQKSLLGGTKYIYIYNHCSGSKNMVPAPVLTVTTFFCLGSISWGHVTRAEKSKHKADSTFDVVLLMEEILHLSMIW